LSTLNVRLGTHGEFLAAAVRGLSSPDAPALLQLGTRALSDPAIGWLDAWAIAADILTFYRERITNEGYLRTAIDEFSLRELAREIGYKPRPGISASVRLAYTLDADAAPVTIPAGAKAQTVPQPGEQMQTFETAEPLDAQAEWSQMKPRTTRVPAIDRVEALTRASLRFEDTSLAVRPGERVLFVYGVDLGQQVVREVGSTRVDVKNAFVEVTLNARPGLTVERARKVVKLVDGGIGGLKKVGVVQAVAAYMLGASAKDVQDALDVHSAAYDLFQQILDVKPELPGSVAGQTLDSILSSLATPPGVQLRSSQLLNRAAADGLDSNSGAPKRASLLALASPQIERNLYAAWQRLPVVKSDLEHAPQTFLVRVTTGAYGAAAPKIPDPAAELVGPLIDPPLASLDTKFAFLDVLVDGISPGSYALVQSPLKDDGHAISDFSTRTVRFAWIRSACPSARGDYGTSGRVTRLELVDPATNDDLEWLPKAGAPGDDSNRNLGFLRNTLYSVQSVAVKIASEPIMDDVGGSTVMLDSLQEGLQSGRWIIVAGERTDIKVNGAPLPGIKDGELAMIEGVTQEPDPDSPGDSLRSVLHLAKPLAYTYKRDATTIYGNVVRASHGETVNEVLGSGDATVPFAKFSLRRAPLTFIAAVTTSGVQGSQTLKANGSKLKEVESLLDAAATDRVYELATDAAGAATATFGDGERGARVPSGQENVRAIYRVGIGSPGNVEAEQISLLTSRPLGVKSVLNPLPASGGADRDGPESIRTNAPLAALALSPLSRLVSVSDYEYFARRFAGIGDAQATKLADGTYECVHVTLAGVNDIPLTLDDDLVASLTAAYDDFGNPALPVVIGIRELIALFIQARVVLLADADADVVVPEIRRRVLDAFSFAKRRLAQPAYLSEVVAAIQAVKGVDWVDVEVFGGISELELRDPAALAKAVTSLQNQASGGPATVVYCAPAMRAADAPPERVSLVPPVDGRAPRLLPAQLAFLVPDVADTLVLNVG
jgi:hypothetical protein